MIFCVGIVTSSWSVQLASCVSCVGRSCFLIKNGCRYLADMQINEMDVGSRSNQYLLSKGNVYLCVAVLLTQLILLVGRCRILVPHFTDTRPNVNVAPHGSAIVFHIIKDIMNHDSTSSILLVVEIKEVIFSGI